MELKEVIASRRSIRKFKTDTVPDEHIREILEAARLAPSGSNLQATRYIVVKDDIVRESLTKSIAATFLTKAPVIIICCIDKQAGASRANRFKELQSSGAIMPGDLDMEAVAELMKKRIMNDADLKANLTFNAAISITHMDLRANDLGLGTCWVGLYDEDKIREILEIEDRYSIINLLAVGYPDQQPSMRPRISFDELVIKQF